MLVGSSINCVKVCGCRCEGVKGEGSSINWVKGEMVWVSTPCVDQRAMAGTCTNTSLSLPQQQLPFSKKGAHSHILSVSIWCPARRACEWSSSVGLLRREGVDPGRRNLVI